MTSLYQMLNGNVQPASPMNLNIPKAPNMFQMMGQFAQAMQNPAAFIIQRFPDIPAEIQNDPNKILAYLQQTRGITNQDIQQLYNNIGWRKPT